MEADAGAEKATRKRARRAPAGDAALAGVSAVAAPSAAAAGRTAAAAGSVTDRLLQAIIATPAGGAGLSRPSPREAGGGRGGAEAGGGEGRRGGGGRGGGEEKRLF